MSSLRSAALLALVLALGGCAVPMRISLTPEHRARINELNAHVVVVQDEVIAAVQPSNVSVATGGGLIGALIDSSITNLRVKSSQEVMGPFYAQIEDVDYRKEFNEAIKRELAHYPIKVSAIATTPRAPSNDDLTRMRGALQPGQALLLVVPRYYLTMDFRSLDVEAVVTMWSKEGPSNGLIERGVLYYQSRPVGTGGRESIARWGAGNAALFRAELRESIVETIRLVLMDIDVTTPAEKESAKAYPFNTGQQQGEIKGRLVKESADRVTILGENQKLYSLPRSSQAAALAAQ